MLRPECLDPKEVLAHLNSLGYHDITPQRLKEFIHDLKKLIKYEQKRNLEDSVECCKSSNSRSSASDCSCEECEETPLKLSSNESCGDSVISDCSTSATFKQETNLKFEKTKKHKHRSAFDIEQAEKAQSSFIRPWNLQGCRDLSGRSKKSLDPVSLYHQYKKLWNQQNIPGETAHSQLRWIVRSKMMGQEPHPWTVI